MAGEGFKNTLLNWWNGPPPTNDKAATNLSGYIAPMQFYRENIDLGSWRSAVSEAERPILPYRVQMQRIFADLVLDAHVSSTWDRRKNLTLLKEFGIFNGETLDEKATELFKTDWFNNLMNYALDAKGYGYSLIGMGEMLDFKFPKLRLIKRENVSPDREILSPLVYSPNGEVQFNDPSVTDEHGNSFYDWSIWVKTPSETGQSICGYGIFYKIARYEILMRHNLSDNATFNEMFAQPYRALYTNLLNDEEKLRAETQLQSMGATGYGIFPRDSEFKFIDGGSAGNGYKSYDNFDERLEKKISKLILGHEDAMAGTPGKLGSQQGEDSPVYQALEDIEVIDNNFIENLVNNQLIPKLQNIGFSIKPGLKFKFKNNKEVEEVKEKQTALNTKVASYLLQLSNAGYKVDPTQVEELTGLKITAVGTETPEQLGQKTKDALTNLYK